MSYTTVTELFTGICDAIRAKDGTTDPISHQDIPSRIAAISGGSSVSPTPPMSDPLIWVDVDSYTDGASVWVNKGSLADTFAITGASIADDSVLISKTGAACMTFSATYNDFTMYTIIKVNSRSGTDTDYPMLGADGTTDNYVKLAFISQGTTSIRATLRSYSGDISYYPHAEQYAILAITCKNGEQVAYVNGCPFLRQTNASNFAIRNICHKCKYTAENPMSAVGSNAYNIKATLAYNAAHTFDEVVAMSEWLKAKYLAG